MNYLKYDEIKKMYVYDIPIQKLEYYRLNNFLTHEQIAEKIGICSKQYRRLLKKENNPHVKTAKFIFKFLKSVGHKWKSN